MATVPTPFDATAAQKLTASQWDAQVRDVLLWLMGNGTNGVYPRVHAFDTTTLAIPNSSATLVTFNSETYDTDTMHNTGATTSRITFTTAGLYEVDYFITISTFTYSTLDFNVRLNAAGVSGGGTSLRTQPFDPSGTNIRFSFTRYFNAGDYIEAFITQVKSSAPGTVNLSGTSLGTRCYAKWIAVA